MVSGTPPDDGTDTRLQAAYVLHYTRYRETSFIVDAFTLAFGRVSMVARGAAGHRSRHRPLYQPFRPLLLSWTGTHGLRTVTGIEDSGPAFDFDNRQLACAYYVNELIRRLLGEDQPQSTVFGLYVLVLSELAEMANVEVPLRRFEVQVLDALGLLPDLARCTASGVMIEAGQHYRFDPDRAVAELSVDGEEEPGSGVRVRGASLLSMASLDFADADVREDAKRLMRRLIEEHLGGRPLQSRAVFDRLMRR